MVVVISVALCIATIVLDQMTKVLLMNTTFTYIPYVAYNTPTMNDGAAFSMLSGARIFFLIFSIVVLALVVYLLITDKFSSSKFFKCTLGVLAGGIIGNFIDRYFIGSVRDFLYIKPLGFVCNIADVAICIATVMLCVYIIFMHKNKKTEDK